MVAPTNPPYINVAIDSKLLILYTKEFLEFWLGSAQLPLQFYFSPPASSAGPAIGKRNIDSGTKSKTV